jgi:hypothetical protein
MAPETPTSETLRPFDLLEWFTAHPRLAVAIGAFCLWVSVSLILRMWFIHRRESFVKKFLWSFTLLIPLSGGSFMPDVSKFRIIRTPRARPVVPNSPKLLR